MPCNPWHCSWYFWSCGCFAHILSNYPHHKTPMQIWCMAKGFSHYVPILVAHQLYHQQIVEQLHHLVTMNLSNIVPDSWGWSTFSCWRSPSFSFGWLVMSFMCSIFSTSPLNTSMTWKVSWNMCATSNPTSTKCWWTLSWLAIIASWDYGLVGLAYPRIWLFMWPLPKVIIELCRTIPLLNTASWEPPESLQMCSTTIDVVKPQAFIAIT